MVWKDAGEHELVWVDAAADDHVYFGCAWEGEAGEENVDGGYQAEKLQIAKVGKADDAIES